MKGTALIAHIIAHIVWSFATLTFNILPSVFKLRLSFRILFAVFRLSVDCVFDAIHGVMGSESVLSMGLVFLSPDCTQILVAK